MIPQQKAFHSYAWILLRGFWEILTSLLPRSSG
ncbi:MAG: hypothetical protein ACI9CF_001824 [Candidatus Omnitrophota bacterium]|jgi:hypothetical protein